MITSMMRRALFSGDGSTLTLDFTTGVLDSRLTFTRGSGTNISGTGPSFIGSNGYVQYAGTNVPRFDYNPSTLDARGLLIEPQATNLLTASNDLTTGWTWTHIADLSGNSSPDNSNNATLWEAMSGNATIIRTAAVGTSAQRTFSFWAKRDTGSGNFQYTLDNGGTWTTLAITSSWVRYVIAATTANHQVGFRIHTNGDTVAIWGCQLEEGSGASSYIPTSANTATRVADHCTMPTSSFITGPLYPQTLFVECIPANPSSAFPDLVRLFDRTGGGTFAYGNEIYYFGSTTMSLQRKISASTNTDRSFASGLAYNTRHKFATAIDSSSFIASYDGLPATGATTAPAALASQVTHMGVGCSGDASPGSVMSGTIRRIKFFPFAMAQSQLNALTTL